MWRNDIKWKYMSMFSLKNLFQLCATPWERVPWTKLTHWGRTIRKNVCLLWGETSCNTITIVVSRASLASRNGTTSLQKKIWWKPTNTTRKLFSLFSTKVGLELWMTDVTLLLVGYLIYHILPDNHISCWVPELNPSYILMSDCIESLLVHTY